MRSSTCRTSPSSALRASTEPYARLLAETARQRFGASWALAESGATGPTGNRYGDAAGHTCIAVAGASERSITLETGSADRVANMRAFAAAAFDLLLDVLIASGNYRQSLLPGGWSSVAGTRRTQGCLDPPIGCCRSRLAELIQRRSARVAGTPMKPPNG